MLYYHIMISILYGLNSKALVPTNKAYHFSPNCYERHLLVLFCKSTKVSTSLFLKFRELINDSVPPTLNIDHTVHLLLKTLTTPGRISTMPDIDRTGHIPHQALTKQGIHHARH